jgi:tetratricopeptide (TPR) repeat protein
MRLAWRSRGGSFSITTRPLETRPMLKAEGFWTTGEPVNAALTLIPLRSVNLDEIGRGEMHMRHSAARSSSHFFISALIFALLVTRAPAQSPKLSNVDLCDGKDRTSPSLQILGCSSLIKSSVNDPKVLASAYNNRGNAFTSEGRYDLAIRDYDQSIKLDPRFAKPFNNRGVAHQKRGEYDYAIDDFDAAISVEPTYANAFANRAETYQKKGDFPHALKDFDEAIRLKPTSAALWNERCWTRAIVGNSSQLWRIVMRPCD